MPWGRVVPVTVVLVVYALIEAASNGISWVVSGPFFSYLNWDVSPSTWAVSDQLVAPHALEVLMILGVIAAFHWWRAVGLVGPEPPRLSAWGIVPLGIVIGTAIAGTVTLPADYSVELLAVVMAGYFLASLVEELIYRGILLHGLSRRWGGEAAVLVSSALFSAAHFFFRERYEALPLLVVHAGSHFAFGVLMCRIRIATGSIWYPVAIHMFWNYMAQTYQWGVPDGPTPTGYLRIAGDMLGMGIAIGVALHGAVRAREREKERAALRAIGSGD